MNRLIISLIFLLIPLTSGAQEVKVLTDAVSLRNLPEGEIVKTINGGETRFLFNKYSFWGKLSKGWVNLDYVDYTLPDYVTTGHVKLKIAVVTSPCEAETDNGSIFLEENSVILLGTEKEDEVFGWYKKTPVAVKKENVYVEDVTFNIASLNKTLKIYSDYGKTFEFLPGEVILIDNNNRVLYKDHLWNTVEFEMLKSKEVDISSLEEEINHLIDIFNGAKYSAPISERIGYYAKLLPVDYSSFEVLKTPQGVGLKVKLKYQFFYRDGKPVEGRKTRLILKKSNFNFWKTISDMCFGSGVNKFVEIEVYRFDGEGGFSKEGFIASSYHYYKDGKLKTLEDFINYSESEFSDDLWFFADEVYERLENGN
ncbi:hypothetical protein GFV12_05470 [Desulfurobacterium thermolithotrophum]|uniref:hypothetical protein n=1 Tax=Desulfurobacterium thermolithotrophum TaxID=64160 RepID=UPI0013D1D342|nr:hypothetical protein [Desulfurobacterium thermolithotrophum]